MVFTVTPVSTDVPPFSSTAHMKSSCVPTCRVLSLGVRCTRTPGVGTVTTNHTQEQYYISGKFAKVMTVPFLVFPININLALFFTSWMRTACLAGPIVTLQFLCLSVCVSVTVREGLGTRVNGGSLS